MTDRLAFPHLCIIPSAPEALASPLPLEHTAIQAQIVGLAASVTVCQRFRNPLTENADLEYLFPLPQEANVTTFELQVGGRTLRAAIQEIERARQQYEDARRKGQRASLLESRRPNLFALQLANLQPGESIEATLHYQQRLEFSAGRVEFVFPMGLTPRYHRPGHPEEAEGVDAPITFDLNQVGDVEINLDVECGLPTADPTSPSHPLIVSRASATRFTVRLDGAHLPNHDFVLRWTAAGESLPFPAWRVPSAGGDVFLATFLPPPPDASAAPISRQYIFVLDRSGSMSGDPIRQAVNALRACLRSLNPQDTFAILLFDDRLEWLAKTTAVTQAAVEMADRKLGKVDGRGGTDILPALQAALSLPPDAERARLVLFLTDGAVSAEEQVLQQVRREIGAAQLFTFGVGPSVNRAFLQQLARLGRGQAEFIGLDEDIEEAILRFQDRVAFPLLTHLDLQAENGQIWDVYPAQLPDLYAGSAVEIVGRCRDSSAMPLTLVASGERLGARVEMRASLATLSPDAALLPRLWARARIEDVQERAELGSLPEHSARAEIIALGLEHSLLTKYTGFVAVDSAVKPTARKSHLIQVAHPLPEGLEPAGFFGAPPPAMYAGLPASPVRTAASIPPPAAPVHAAGIVREPEDYLMNLPHSFEEAGKLSAPQSAPMLKESVPPADGAAFLRELARTQNLNGSWNEDVERTAAALLAFVRHGQTTLRGHFRKQTGRAFTWLLQNAGAGFAAWLRALALHELAEATAGAQHLAAAQSAASRLPAPSNEHEKAVLAALQRAALPPQPPTEIQTLDALRLAVVRKTAGARLALQLQQDELGRILSAALPPRESA